MPDCKISVIVPVYNVEAYLPKCLDSILAQSHKNLEIILINDGSPDNCPKICDEYAEKDSRIKVIHKKNGGVASARNAGLKISTGEYIAFVDSDDWIEPTMYSDLLDVCLNQNCDYVGCSAKVHGGTEEQRGGASGLVKFLTANEYFADYLNGNMFLTIWSRLCKREVCIDIEFPENRAFCEDGFIALPTLEKAKKIAFLEKALYNYNQSPREDSSVRGKVTIAKLSCWLDLYHSWFIYSKKNGRIFDKAIRKKYNGLFERAAKLIKVPVPHKLFALIPFSLTRFTVNILNKI
ncbi:MAG: glycosyltransferase [Fibromonadaceae bacterium]|jgi:glycosyltransferase involved in cell wall biosynthesis|nr:glycosyltransferase [Fibromonadaceae bacterium]